MNDPGHVIALCGGVGGAKLAAGLSRILAPEYLTVVVNTGDDFDHMGLRICPDLDSVMYAMAGINDSARGWGLADETWNCMAMLSRLGGPNWFQLGDRDLATHLMRTRGLQQGASLSEVTADLCRALGVMCNVMPMTNDAVRTALETDCGRLSFQEYFVRHRWQPEVRTVHFAGADTARLAPSLVQALESPALKGVIVCPSNPYLSIDPILAVPGFRDRLRMACIPVVAVSPYVRRDAVKGPAAKMARELGGEPAALGIAKHYCDFVHAVVSDEPSAGVVDGDVLMVQDDTLMLDPDGQNRLASRCVQLLAAVGRRL